ncbi:MAG: 4-hydroxythreonine-4-phosphate dehydrogenase PdxA [Bacillota bacterium]|nr:4-hydroxythreonine-4-phosphate dehydrogenase PdxA [Bacillota bacterium]
MYLDKPVIGIPIGDPAGIGPEIAIKALMHEELFDICKPLLIGNTKVLDKIIKTLGLYCGINEVDYPDQGKYQKGTANVINIDVQGIEKVEYGKIQQLAGKAAYEFIVKSIELANEGLIDSVATTPINKEAIKAARINFIGHTEIFGALTGTEDPLTMFQVHNLRIFFLSRHVSIRKACDMVTRERLLDYIKRCSKALEMLGVRSGSLAVAGLNPHNGEHGLFGKDETEEITPAVEVAVEQGIDVTGPVPADSVFAQALKGKYSAVLSLYHDQGHIAAKTLDFEKTISLTIGMPFLRTSVDHGTAFDIAGTGSASETSMVEAVKLAAEYSFNYRQKAKLR